MRGPFFKPKDLLAAKGDIELSTINKEDFITHSLPEKRTKEPLKYVPPSGAMDLDSEYHSNYLGETIPPAKIPQYLRSVTQRVPSGKMQAETTSRTDYKKYSKMPHTMPVSNGNKYAPPKSPFSYTSVHRADFLRFNEPKRATGRQPDKINMKDLPMELETSHQTDFKRHSIKRNDLIRRSDEYEKPSGPFDGNSLMHTDYVKHVDAKRANREKPVTTVFRTNEKMERTTTNLEDYKTWVAEAPKPKQKQQFQKPAGEMFLKPISSDYKHFGKQAVPAKSARPKTKLRTGRDGPFCGTSNYTDDFKQWASLPALPVKLQDELITLSPRRTKFDANSEHREAFKRFNTAPARIFKPGTHVFKTDDAMSSKTVYMTEYDGRSAAPCLSEKILNGSVSGFQLQEDFDTGHRYVIDSQEKRGDAEGLSKKNSNGHYTKLSSIEEQKPEASNGLTNSLDLNANTAIT